MNKTQSYTPLHVHTHYSLLDGLSKPKDIVKRCEELDISCCAMTDHANITGCINFHKTLTKANIKPIIGCEINISKMGCAIKKPENYQNQHLLLLAKNYKGWKTLIKIVSAANHKDRYYHKPRLDMDTLADYLDDNIIGLSGHVGSTIAHEFFDNPQYAFSLNTYEEIKDLIKPNWIDHVETSIKYHQKIFSEENFYLEIQLFDTKYNPIQQILSEGLRYVGKKLQVPTVCTTDAHYCTRKDADDQRVLLCRNMKTTFANVNQKLQTNDNFSLAAFFKSNNYYIPSSSQLLEFGHTEKELENSNIIANMCEEYKITSDPVMPKFVCVNGQSSIDYLKKLCNEGWKRKIQTQVKRGKIDKEKVSIYKDRIRMEIDVLEEFNLSDYFLVIRDVLQYVTGQGYLVGAGRGSSAGCLVSYLIDITQVDPIKYDLLFSRFINAGRLSKDRVSLPDIDIDVPISVRGDIMAYLKLKYGEENVGQVLTIQTLVGRGALKTVLGAYADISFEEQNEITSHITDKSKITGKLQEMEEETGESSVIKWAIENKPELKEYCHYNSNGGLEGPFAKRFEQAIRLEGTKISASRHASAYVISPLPLYNMCPTSYEKGSEQQIIALEYPDAEAIGMVKLDVLGLAFLDKIQGISTILKEGNLNE